MEEKKIELTDPNAMRIIAEPWESRPRRTTYLLDAHICTIKIARTWTEEQILLRTSN
jgi:hypothetical protein